MNFFTFSRTNETDNMYVYDWITESNDYTSSVNVLFFDKEEVPFIEVQDFLDISHSIIDTENITYTSDSSGFTVSYYEENFDTTMTLVYNSSTEEITVNHFEFFNYLDTENIYETESVYLSSVSQNNTYTLTEEVVLDLSSYNLTLEYKLGKYYIPIALGNLIFSTFEYGVYFTGEDIYILDYPNQFSLDLLYSKYYTSTAPMDLQEHTFDVLAFYFDYFYGGNFDKSEHYYLNLITDTYLPKLDGTNEMYYQTVDFFMMDQNDLHLYFDFEGYYGDSYTYDYSGYTYTGRNLVDQTAATYYQDYCETNESRKLNSSVTVLVVNDFESRASGAFAYEVALYVDDNTTDVIIDLTCNGGGYVEEYLDMLPFFTDSLIKINETNFKYDGEYDYYYASTIEAINKNIYVRTSGLTYSAGNMFTAYIKENDLGTIIGENTNGGSSYIDLLYLPGGMIAYGPTLIHETDNLNDILEYGITVDYVYNALDDASLLQLIDSINGN